MNGQKEENKTVEITWFESVTLICIRICLIIPTTCHPEIPSLKRRLPFEYKPSWMVTWSCVSALVTVQPHGGYMSCSMTLIFYWGMNILSSVIFKPRRVSLNIYLKYKLKKHRKWQESIWNLALQSKNLVHHHHRELVKNPIELKGW